MITLIALGLTVIVILISGLVAILSGDVGLFDYICSIACTFFMLQFGMTYDTDDDMTGGVWTVMAGLGFMFLWWFTTYSILGEWVGNMDTQRRASFATTVFLFTGFIMFVLGQWIQKSRSYGDFIWKDTFGMF